MILSVSRRTDIPARYADWFFERMRQGYVLVRNPRSPHRVARIELTRETVDGIVFWTKNPAPMLDRLPELDGYPYYFQFTLNAYGREVEPGVPSKSEFLIPVFRQLARRIGSERVLWRYDPILYGGRYTMAYHLGYFRRMAERLAGCTDTCTVSFLDFYRRIGSRTRPLGLREPEDSWKTELLARFAAMAKECGIALRVCAEKTDYTVCGASPARCVDPERLGKLGGCRLRVGRDPNQRAECGCAASVDIGAYDTCPHGCLYCYANSHAAAVGAGLVAYWADSPLLCGQIGEGDTIYPRECASCRETQMRWGGA